MKIGAEGMEAVFGDHIEETFWIIKDSVICLLFNNGCMLVNNSTASPWQYNTD